MKFLNVSDNLLVCKAIALIDGLCKVSEEEIQLKEALLRLRMVPLEIDMVDEAHLLDIEAETMFEKITSLQHEAAIALEDVIVELKVRGTLSSVPDEDLAAVRYFATK